MRRFKSLIYFLLEYKSPALSPIAQVSALQRITSNVHGEGL